MQQSSNDLLQSSGVTATKVSMKVQKSMDMIS